MRALTNLLAVSGSVRLVCLSLVPLSELLLASTSVSWAS